jgi:hypothetical protein
MSSVSGIGSNLLSTVLSALTQNNSTTASAGSQSATTTGNSSTASKQTDAIGLALAEEQFSLNQSLLNAMPSPVSFQDLAMFSENLNVLKGSHLINTHPDLVQSLLSGSFSQTTQPSSLETELLNTLERANTSQNNTNQMQSLLQLAQLKNQNADVIGSIIDKLA